MELHQLLAHHESGHFRSRQPWRTTRDHPTDHLIIWVRSGGMEIVIDETSLRAGQGDLVVLSPGQAHDYAPSTATGWEWMWLHFGGAAADDLAARLVGPAHQHVRPLGEDQRILARFTELVIAAGLADVTADPGAALHLNSCAYSLLGLMVRTVESLADDLPDPGADLTHLTTWVLDHLDRPFGLPDLVRASGWSSAQLSRLTRRELGLSPMQYATRLRMRHAERLLRDSTLGVAQISTMVGFDDPLHFSRRFRQLHGVPPTVFRAAATTSAAPALGTEPTHRHELSGRRTRALPTGQG